MAGDFNSAAWPCDIRNNISTIEDAFADSALPMPPGPTPLCGLGAVPRKWADVGGSLNSPGFRWKMESPSARSILHSPRSSWYPPDLPELHHKAWLHLDFVEWRSEQAHHERHDRRILLKERSAPYHYGKQKGHISDVMSDHSLSS